MSIHLAEPVIHPTAVVAETAVIRGQVTIHPHAFILFGVVIRAEVDQISVGEATNIQDNSVVHCDRAAPCRIGNRVTVGHLALVHGAQIGDHCLIGMGAKVLNGAEVGEGAWVASGSLVPERKKIPPWSLAMGTPARVVRDLTDEEIQFQDQGISDYLKLAAAYKNQTG